MRTEGRAESTLTAQFSGKGPSEVVWSKPLLKAGLASQLEQLAQGCIQSFWDRDFKTSLGNLLQCLTAVMREIFSLYFVGISLAAACDHSHRVAVHL